MPLLPLIGHDALKTRLVKAAERGALPASLLLYGPARVGKQRLALWLGQALLCESATSQPCGECKPCRLSVNLTHPDLHWFFPRPRTKDSSQSPEDALQDVQSGVRERVASHGLYPPASGTDGIRLAYVQAMTRQAAMSPAMAARKVFVVGEAHQMVQGGTMDAANAFLKLLEEPPANTTIILTSSEPGALLPTVRSRVAMIRVPRVSDGAMRQFLEQEPVRKEIESQELPTDEASLLRTADGAPGELIGVTTRMESSQAASALLAAIDKGRAARLRAAWVQGGAGARGPFTDMLDELTSALRDKAREAVERDDEVAAFRYSVAVGYVEEAKERANDNVNPQLVTAALVRALERESAR